MVTFSHTSSLIQFPQLPQRMLVPACQRASDGAEQVTHGGWEVDPA